MESRATVTLCIHHDEPKVSPLEDFNKAMLLYCGVTITVCYF